MTIFGVVLLMMFTIGLIQMCVGLIGVNEYRSDEMLGLGWAGGVLVGLSALMFLGYAIGTGGTFS